MGMYSCPWATSSEPTGKGTCPCRRRRRSSRALAPRLAPLERHGNLYVRVQAAVDGAVLRGGLEPPAVLFVELAGDADLDAERADPPLRLADHFLRDAHAGAVKGDVVPLGDNAHRRQHARAERGGDEVRR